MPATPLECEGRVFLEKLVLLTLSGCQQQATLRGLLPKPHPLSLLGCPRSRPRHSPVQYLRLQEGVPSSRYTWYPPGQAATCTSAFQEQQLPDQWAQAVRVTMPCPGAGWAPCSHMGASVWHLCMGTQVSGILVPPSPTKRNQPCSSRSHFWALSVTSELREGSSRRVWFWQGSKQRGGSGAPGAPHTGSSP